MRAGSASILVVASAMVLAGRSSGLAQPAGAPQAANLPSNLTVPMTTGTGAISGVVTDSVTHQPIADVVVFLGPANRGPAGEPTRQFTDAKGRFVFRNLPAAEAYYINASKFGYFDGLFGHSSPVLGSRIVLAAGQWISDANISLNRAAAISGTVRDEHGDPMVGVYVRGLAQLTIGGERRLAAGPVTTTDDRGAYRLAGLRAGSYLVSIPSVQNAVPSSTSDAELSGVTAQAAATLQATGAAAAPTVASLEVDPATRLVVGRYPAPIPSSTGPTTYPIVFFPNTRTATTAAPIVLAYGDERNGVDFALAPVPAVRISGVVQGPPDGYAGLTLRLISPGSEDLGNGAETATALVGPSGAFTFLNVPNGEYTIDARRLTLQYEFSTALAGIGGAAALPQTPASRVSQSSAGVVAAAPEGTSLSMRGSAGGYWGRAVVHVDGRDVRDVVVELKKGVTLAGRIVREGVQSGPPPSLRAEPSRGNVSLGILTAAIQAPANTFKVEGLLPGEYFLGSANTRIKSIEWRGRDYTARAFDTSDGADITDVVVTLTDQTIVLSGNVRDSRGNTVTNAAVIVFPVERELWESYGFNPARIKSTDVASGYRIQTLPAGDYFAIAVGADLVDAWQDAKFLEDAAAVATKLTLAWGDQKTQDLVLTTIK
jgi:hypothetical protein